MAEKHATAEVGVYKFFRYYEEINVIDHLHAMAKEFVTYGDISGGAFQATERTEKIGKKHIPIIGNLRASKMYRISPICVYSEKV